MTTLLTLFSKQRQELQGAIDKTTNPEQVVMLVQNQLNTLESSYIGGLSVSQVRLAAFFLDALRQSVATLAAANPTHPMQFTTPEPESEAKLGRQLSPKRLILKVLQGLLCIGILDSLFNLSSDAPGAWLDILLMALLVGLEVVSQLDKSSLENPTDTPESTASQLTLRIDSQVLLDNIAEALNTIDLAVAQAQDGKKTVEANAIEEQPELLNLLQRLIGASFLEKPQMALELTKLIPQILIEQGIEAKLYQPDDVKSHREYFDFEPSINPNANEYITIAPALVKGDRLLRRGRVIEPRR
ncbi:hypothetical protein [Coleofasciculus sp. F4-SAH-05]|uniref:hypothetical protein n=1 Tax=Coleofasciculus sp. F4-SAH-05 TaxID=3069525 RepID=UPI0032F55B4F